MTATKSKDARERDAIRRVVRTAIAKALQVVSHKLDALEPRQTAIFNRLEFIVNQGRKIMTTFKEFAALQQEHNTRHGAALDQVVVSQGGLTEDIKYMNDLILKLQTGELSPENEATAKELTDVSTALVTKAEAVAAALKALDDMTPPTAPTA